VRDLMILGAGPHAQEMTDIVRQINARTPTWHLLGFLVPETQADLVSQEMGSVVVKDVPPHSVVMGNPARVRDDE
jgi:hypothetical protein